MSWRRRLGLVLVVLVVLLAAGAGTVYGVSQSRLARSYADVPAHPVPVPTGAEAIARGAHIARAVIKCVDCHKADLGGGTVVDDPAIGTVAATNITAGAGGVLAQYTDADLERAIRHGVGRDGRGLWVMPSYEVHQLTDEDLGALIAYLRSVAPVERTVLPRRLGPVGRALYLGGQLPLIDAARINHAAPHPARLAPAPTAEYGRYAARVGGCFGCHGEGLSGGPIPGGPPDWKPASNITPTGLQGYDEAAFTTLLRTGLRPSGTPVDTLMPWRYTKDLTDDEVKALWAFLRTVPPREFGGR